MVCSKALKPRSVDDTPSALFHQNLQPSIGNCALVQTARQDLQRKKKEQELQQYLQMISELTDLPEQERLSFAFKFFKHKKRTSQSTLYANISISQWERELSRSEGPPVPLLPENLPIPPELGPPTLEEVLCSEIEKRQMSWDRSCSS
jgi:hypothetical protein